MIRTVQPAPYYLAECEMCGVTGDRYVDAEALRHGEGVRGWHFRRAWLPWRWTARCPQCASVMRTLNAAVARQITAEEAARRLEDA